MFCHQNLFSIFREPPVSMHSFGKPAIHQAFNMIRCLWYVRLTAERTELKQANPSRLKVVHRKTVHPRKPKGFIATYPGQCVGVDTRHPTRYFSSLALHFKFEPAE